MWAVGKRKVFEKRTCATKMLLLKLVNISRNTLTLLYVWHFFFILNGGRSTCFVWNGHASERLFKLWPHVAPEPVRLNHIPDMALRSSMFFLNLWNHARCILVWLVKWRAAAALCLSLWWHFILMLWLTRTILQSESWSYDPDLFEYKKEENGRRNECYLSRACVVSWQLNLLPLFCCCQSPVMFCSKQRKWP